MLTSCLLCRACEPPKHLQLGKSPHRSLYFFTLLWRQEITKGQHKPAIWVENGAKHFPPFFFFSCFKQFVNVNAFSSLWTFYRFLRKLGSLLSVFWWETSFSRTWNPPLNIKELTPIPQSLGEGRRLPSLYTFHLYTIPPLFKKRQRTWVSPSLDKDN